jgi:hypothetical protein
MQHLYRIDYLKEMGLRVTKEEDRWFDIHEHGANVYNS